MGVIVAGKDLFSFTNAWKGGKGYAIGLLSAWTWANLFKIISVKEFSDEKDQMCFELDAFKYHLALNI